MMGIKRKNERGNMEDNEYRVRRYYSGTGWGYFNGNGTGDGERNYNQEGNGWGHGYRFGNGKGDSSRSQISRKDLYLETFKI